jgi:hypothetical protein
MQSSDRQVMAPHGFAAVEWDHASLPERFWARTTLLPNGCWRTSEAQPRNIRELAILRILRINPKEALAITPTCGDWYCVNPAHTCLTMRTDLSGLERG